MLLCDAPESERWTPDFSSSGQRPTEWTRVTCDGLQLINGCEWVDWDADPVQVVLCEACGITDCESGGYVRVTRLGDHVLWTAPVVADEWDRRQYETTQAVRAAGAVAIPAVVWATWPGVPAPASLPAARRADLRAAWEASAPPRADAIASDAGSLEDAFALVDAAARWFDGDAEARALVPAGRGVVTLFYESPRFTEWTPVARVGDEVLPVFAGRFVSL
jgi:hypothetical protein